MPTLPHLLRILGLRVRALFLRRGLHADIRAELQTHLARATDRYIAHAMSPGDAQLAARKEFGNVSMLQEEAGEAYGAGWVDSVSGDMRFALRYFARRRGTTAIILSVIALATGANALIF